MKEEKKGKVFHRWDEGQIEGRKKGKVFHRWDEGQIEGRKERKSLS
ncbi:hypothetical protein AB3Z07_21520 [Metabacillus halosaccharovorans]